uniref:Uncharacterized protein n=1 Tax=Micrurus carvalhoi TaxID=3147026 RepID=A0A2H6N4B5_9SAUR
MQALGQSATKANRKNLAILAKQCKKYLFGVLGEYMGRQQFGCFKTLKKPANQLDIDLPGVLFFFKYISQDSQLVRYLGFLGISVFLRVAPELAHLLSLQMLER